MLRAGHQMYFGKVVPWVGARLSDAAAYRYLPESVVYLPPPEEVCAMLRAGGFTAVGQRQLSTSIAQLFTATKADGGRAGG